MMLRWVLRMWAPGAPLPVGEPVESRFRVLPVDLDLLMHMNNGRYLSVLDAARIGFYTRTGLWRQLRSRGWTPVVTAQSISYRRPLTFPRSFQVRTQLVGTDAKNLYFQQTFHIRDVDYATAMVSVRLTDRSGASVTPAQVRTLRGAATLPDRLPDTVAAWAQLSRHHHAQKQGQR